MVINKEIYKAIKEGNNFISTKQVLFLGFSKQLLTKYVQNGVLERVRQGVYTFPDIIHDDMYTISLCSAKMIFSHDTALFLHGLSERTPFVHTVTMPSNAALPKSLKNECICFYVKPELFTIGVTEKKTTFGNPVKCYDVERTICDFIRCRKRCNEEMVVSAIKNYASYDKKNLNLLVKYAKIFKIEKEVKRYLEVLL
jgi:predicted transcriptional regulator of viral defense system